MMTTEDGNGNYGEEEDIQKSSKIDKEEIGTSPNYNIECAWMSLIRTRFMLMRYIYS